MLPSDWRYLHTTDELVRLLNNLMDANLRCLEHDLTLSMMPEESVARYRRINDRLIVEVDTGDLFAERYIYVGRTGGDWRCRI